MRFDDAYRDYYDRIKRHLIYKFSNLPLDMDDILQETFIVAWRNWPKRANNVSAWLIGIARNIIRHEIRNGGRDKRGGGIPHVQWLPDIDHRAERPAQDAIIILSQARKKIASLGPAQQVAINGIMAGMTNQEIAQQQGVSHQAVACSLKLARERLSEYA